MNPYLPAILPKPQRFPNQLCHVLMAELVLPPRLRTDGDEVFCAILNPRRNFMW